jgi:hypothetical protein
MSLVPAERWTTVVCRFRIAPVAIFTVALFYMVIVIPLSDRFSTRLPYTFLISCAMISISESNIFA